MVIMIRSREDANVHDGANNTSFWTPPSPPINLSITDNVGDPLPAHKPSNTTRLYFANVNGLQYGAQGGDLATTCNTMHNSHIDILGLVETKLDSNLYRQEKNFRLTLHSLYLYSSNYSSPARHTKYAGRLRNSFPPLQYSVAHHSELERRKTSAEEKS
jgi:hypothetical protein